MSDYEYVHVELLKNVIKGLLDNIIAGEEIDVSKDGKKNKVAPKIVSVPKLFTCNVCDWQTKFSSALKGHTKRIHSKVPMPSTKMSEKKSDSSKQSSENSETNKEEPTRKRSSIVFQCNDCGL